VGRRRREREGHHGEGTPVPSELGQPQPLSSSPQLPLAAHSPHSIKMTLLDRTSVEINQGSGCRHGAELAAAAAQSRRVPAVPSERGRLPQAQRVLAQALQKLPELAVNRPPQPSFQARSPCLSQTLRLPASSVSRQQAVLSALASPASPEGPGRGLPLPPLPSGGKRVFNETPRWMAALSSHFVTAQAPCRQSSALAKSVGKCTGACTNSS